MKEHIQKILNEKLKEKDIIQAKINYLLGEIHTLENLLKEKGELWVDTVDKA